MPALTLALVLPSTPLRRSVPAPIGVVLRNLGHEAVLVNARLAPGYDDSVSRELYFDVTAEHGEVARYRKRKYERAPALPPDYVPLEPGAALAAEVDLLAWYRLADPGRYLLTGHYQADEAIAEPPGGVVRGVIDSPTYPLVVA